MCCFLRFILTGTSPFALLHTGCNKNTAFHNVMCKAEKNGVNVTYYLHLSPLRKKSHTHTFLRVSKDGITNKSALIAIIFIDSPVFFLASISETNPRFNLNWRISSDSNQIYYLNGLVNINRMKFLDYSIHPIFRQYSF